MTSPTVAMLVGSLRKASLNRQLAHALIALNAAPLNLEIVEIADLALYNQDLETDPPPAPWLAFRQRIQAADAILFLTPEYNRSMSGCLKNAIDVASRPRGHNAWDGKPGAVISLSPGVLGGFGANQAVRQCLVALNVPVMQQPEAYLSGADKLFDDQGNIANPSTRDFLTKFIQAFAAWIEANRKR
jgi:chromate reductase, NAD(P)H dehydrogenase (quinone)